MNHTRPKKTLIAGSLLLVLSLLLQLSARMLSGFGEWYGTRIYPVLVFLIGGFSGLFPFSLVELALYLSLIFCLVYGITHIRQPLKLAANTFFILCLLAFSYTVHCGINYSRLPFSSFLNLEIRPSSEEELYRLCIYLAEQTSRAQKEITENHLLLHLAPSQARNDMKKLGQTYPQLSGFYPRPKPLLVPEVLSFQSLSGIYSPFTIEANYNGDMVSYNIPFTACHELSHLRGFMREDEANFIGYLACAGSDSAWSRYSGYLSGFVYAANALYRQNPESASAAYALLPAQALTDLHTNNVFWQQYEGPIAEVSTQVNDTYLKANQQNDGVKSYGRMVDLLLAYYRQELNHPN